MKLTYALIFSACAFTSSSLVTTNTIAAQASSGEVKASNASLLMQLSQEKAKVSKLEAEVAALHKTVDSLKAMIGKIGNTSALSAEGLPSKYTIKAGETITQIANRHHISREQLMQMNGIGENQQIYIGDELLIPATPVAASSEVVVVADTSGEKQKQEKTQSPAPTPAPTQLAVTTTSTSAKKAPAKSTTIAWTQKEKTEPAKEEIKKAPAKQAPPAVIEVAKVEKTKAPKRQSQKEEKPLTLVEFEKAVKASTPKEKPEVAKVAQKTDSKKSTPKVLAKTESSKGYSEYTIKFGDNLGKIAKKHGITIGALMSFNGITNPDKISGGQKLEIPSKETAKSLSKVKPASSSDTATLAKTGDKPTAEDDLGIYTVQTGDTLYELARDFYTTEKELQRLNQMGSSSKIIPGQDLIVPTSEYFKKRDLATN
ncbi:MAG: LysM peptidoglycan-binding domain-containing protein [Verrucomicrobiales bacterium]|nr:LysM peptidoglycan-binding domain-containing protein [Verrucomicrobiales bacterium]